MAPVQWFVSITRKPLDKAPRRLQGMLVRALNYDIEVKYQRGKEMYLADTQSRASLPRANHEGQDEFETINAVNYLAVPDERIQELCHHTNEDPPLQQLKATIQQGWPEDKSTLSPVVRPYFSLRDELTVADELIFRGERLVIPKSMRSRIKKEIHTGHLGVEGSLRRARESVFWPGMNAEVKAWIQTCETCREFETSQPKETLVSHPVPERPWEKVGSDLFTFREKTYLITVCYRSNFWEIDLLQSDATSKAVIKKLKAHFARYGIPSHLVTDNGPQFASAEFRKFTIDWGITHTTSSPHHSKAKGKVKSAVKSAKRMLLKTTRSGEYQYLALLNLRNVPSQGVQTSPAQRHMGRRTRTLLPVTKSLLEAKGPPPKAETEQLKPNQQRQAKYYNTSARDLQPLKPGDTVRIKPFQLGKKSWAKGEVTQCLDKRSYEVTAGGTTYRWNRQHLVKTHEPPGQHLGEGSTSARTAWS